MIKYSLLFIALLLGSFTVVAEPEDDTFTEDEMSDDFSAPTKPVESPVSDNETSQATVDRLEEWNKKVFRFNDNVDRIFLKPVAQGYDKVTPSIVNRGITNVFGMLGELPNAGNALLQQKPVAAGDSILRFMINATVGVLGFFDVATAIGIDEHDEDFGQTLAYWGVPEGHYLVLPFLGSSTVRNLHGWVFDGLTNPVNQIEHTNALVAVKSVDVVDSRADLLKVEELVSGNRYSFLRNAYLQDRHYLENDGNVEDTFDTGETEDENWLE